MSQFWPSCISGTSHTPCREVPSALLPACSTVVMVLAQLHIWHKSRTLPGSPICTVACLLCCCLILCL